MTEYNRDPMKFSEYISPEMKEAYQVMLSYYSELEDDQPKLQLGYPYYIDTENPIEINFTSSQVRVLAIVAFATLPLLFFKINHVNALEGCSISSKVSNISLSNVEKPAKRRIHETACVCTGYCAAKAQESMKNKQPVAAFAFFCGMCTFGCVEYLTRD